MHEKVNHSLSRKNLKRGVCDVIDEVLIEDNGCIYFAEVKDTADSFDDSVSVEENGCFLFDEVLVEDNGCFSSAEVKVIADSFDDPVSVEENGCSWW